MIEISHQQARRLIRMELDLAGAADARMPSGSQNMAEEQWAAAQAHMENCAECRAYRERLAGIEKMLRRSIRSGWERVSGPAEGTALRIVEIRAARELLRRRILWSAMAAAVLVVVLLSGQAVLRSLANHAPDGTGSLSVDDAGAVGTQVPYSSLADAFPTPNPTIQAGGFPAVVALQARAGGRPDGQWQIYLLNPGSPPENLSKNNAQETDPAWSPDGSWLAFLSDRSGKSELYVTNLTGNAVQLTERPEITWQGPLSWSPDGQSIALTGIRENEGTQSWIYLVDINGARAESGGGRSLPGTRGGSMPEFSPTGQRLAFLVDDGLNSGESVADLGTGHVGGTTWPVNPLSPLPLPGSMLDWSPDGSALAYVSTAPPEVASASSGSGSDAGGELGAGGAESGAQVLAVRDMGISSGQFSNFPASLQVASSRWPGAFRSVTWLTGGGPAGGGVAYLEDLNDSRANEQRGSAPAGCWTIQVRNVRAAGGSSPAVFSSALCVESALDRGSWTSDGRWLVVVGRMPGEQQRSIYAVRMPGGRSSGLRYEAPDGMIQLTPQLPAAPLPQTALPGGMQPVGTVERLSEDLWSGPLPRVRPSRSFRQRSLDIRPSAVTRAGGDIPPSNFSLRLGGPGGQIVYVVQNNNMSMLVRANPDGTGGRVLAATPGKNRCPRWSPDGGSLAVISQQGMYPSIEVRSGSAPAAGGAGLGEELYVMDSDGGNARQVSQVETIPDYRPGYQVTFGCPVWSPPGTPGGPLLAATLSTPGHAYLAIYPVRAPGSQAQARLGNIAPQVFDTPYYLAIGEPAAGVLPVWTPEGRSLFFADRLPGAASRRGETSLRIARVNLPMRSGAGLTADYIPASQQVQGLAGLVMDPDARSMVALNLALAPGAVPPVSVRPGAAQQERVGQLLVISLFSGRARQTGEALKYHPGSQSGGLDSAQVTWLFRNTLGFVLRGDAQSHYKAWFYRADLPDGALQPLSGFEDVVNEAAWSPDGRWVVFSAESGLWGLDADAAARGQARPTWLSPVPVEGLDWK